MRIIAMINKVLQNILGKKLTKDKYSKNKENISILLYHKDDKKSEWIEGYFLGRRNNKNIIALQKEDGTEIIREFDDSFKIKKRKLK